MRAWRLQGGGAAQGGVLRPDLPGAMQRAGVDKQSALYRAVVRIQSRYRGYVIRKVRHPQELPTHSVGRRSESSLRER